MKFLKKLFVSASIFAASASTFALTIKGPVVDVEWLSNNLSQVQVVEVRSDMNSLKHEPEIQVDKKTGKKTIIEVGGHLVGSRVIDMKTMRVTRKIGDLPVQSMIPLKADFEKLIQDAGIDAGKPIVFVPMGQAIEDIDDVLRVYWQFKVYGESNMAVLNGGVAAWLLSGREVTQAPVVAKVGTWKAGKEQMQFLAESAEVAAESYRKGQLVDSRAAPQFYGLSKRDVVYSYGHIENAKSVTPDLLTKNSQGAAYFHSPKTYSSIFSASGIDASKPTITYCNTGHLASGTWFALAEIVGNAQAKLYDGSMHQWTLEKRPTIGVDLN